MSMARTSTRDAGSTHGRSCLTMPAIRLMAIALIAVLAGCASIQERQSFHDLYLEAGAFTGADGRSIPAETPELGEAAGLSDYLAYAALSNPGLEAAFNDWKATLERVPQARALPDPRFTFVHYVEAVETRVGPQERSFALMQTFPWLGKLRSSGEIALKEAEAARQRYEAAKLRVFYQVTHAYYEYYYLSRAISVTEGDIGLVSGLEEVARTKYQVGAVPYSALIKAQVELGKLEDALETLKDLEGPTAARLNKTLGRPPDTYMPWPTPGAIEENTFSDDEIYADLRKNHPALLALGFMASK